ncbi:MAG: hypothetical protein Q4C96_05810, partial [Planctomycetia bacterium]|nr:hypothetical protein [Planctomycetia bacterium]
QRSKKAGEAEFYNVSGIKSKDIFSETKMWPDGGQKMEIYSISDVKTTNFIYCFSNHPMNIYYTRHFVS